MLTYWPIVLLGILCVEIGNAGIRAIKKLLNRQYGGSAAALFYGGALCYICYRYYLSL